MDFDYKRAWKELAKPVYDSLPDEIHLLVGYVNERSRDLHQDRDLSMPWPKDNGELQKRFAETDLATLSLASRAVYFYGHWAPHGVINTHSGGTYWKFAHYADQTLRSVLLKQPRDGTFYQIHEGVVRVCYSDSNTWTWEEVGLASDLDLIREEVKTLAFGRSDFYLSAQKLLYRVGMQNPISAPWLDKNKFMIPKTEEEKLLVALREIVPPPHWCIDSISHINFKPHPFTIGLEHIKDGFIDTSVGCAYRDRDGKCGLPPEKHTSDTVVSLLYLGKEEPILTEAFVPSDWLMQLKEIANGEVEGFIFPGCKTK